MTYARFVGLVIVVAIAGCDDSDQQCALYDRGGAPDIAAQEYRDPISGTCQSFGGYDCSDPCQPCPGLAEGVVAQPDWALCYAQCEGLDENTCKGTPACRAIYEGNNTVFNECWGVAQSGPVQGGNCTSFDAYECSRHDDCIAIHAAGTPIGSFLSCAPETSDPNPGSCVGAITCTTPAPACPAGTLAGRANGCWTGYCIPYAQCDQLPACSELNEMDCIARTDCAPTYEGHNCTCTQTSCTCQTWTFDTCKTN